MMTRSGTEVDQTIRLKVLLCSNILSFSLVIGTSNGTRVVPGGNLTLYGPES